MDLVLNNLQRWICHKTQTTNQPVYDYPQSSKYQWLFNKKKTKARTLESE